MLSVAENRWPKSELIRFRHALAVWSGEEAAEGLPGQEAKGFFMPGLKDEPWIEPQSFAFASLLQAGYMSVRSEVDQLRNGKLPAPPYGLDDNASASAPPTGWNPSVWREWRLYRAGSFLLPRCAYFPQTTKLIELIVAQTGFLMNAIFLVMGPGGHLPPHTDLNNLFVNVWLPLVAPQGNYLTVAGRTVHPVEGEVIAFNHSFIHSAGNSADSARIVLSLSTFHPDLTVVEQALIRYFAPQLARGTLEV